MDAEQISALLEAAVGEGVAPGLVAGVSRPGAAEVLAAAGTRGVADPTPMAVDDVFWIASCTKAIASAAALQLVEQGRLDLDAPVGERLAQLAAPRVLDGVDEAGRPRLRAARRPITLRHLLTHTSGLAYDFFCADLAAHYAASGGSLAADLAAPVLVFEPGEAWQYGIGVDAAAWLVEAVADRPFADYAAENIFAPLGMASSSFDPQGPLASRLVAMHRRGESGALEPADRFPSAPQLHGGGGLYSTAGDYLKFLRAVLAPDGAGVFGPRTLAWLREPQDHPGAAGDLATAMPPLSLDFRPMPGVPKRWTLGFLRNEADVPGGRRAGSLAWGGLANCYYWADPQSGVAGLLFGQFLPFADPRMLDVFGALERGVYAA
jgi:CubicO group peptidase (beta-lactamase class C family)